MATQTATRKRPAARKPARTEYLNVTQGWLGAVQLNRRQEEVSVAIKPGGRIFLTDEEKELTAESHESIEASPFEPREIIYIDPSTGDEISRATLCPLELASNFRRSGGKVIPTP